MSNEKKSIIIETSDCSIIIDHWIKTCSVWVARVEILCKKVEKAYAEKPVDQLKKDVNIQYTKLGHSLEEIAEATEQAMGCYITGVFKPC